MSDQVPPESSPSTLTIIQNLQQLTDIEGDLADTAVAVVAAAETDSLRSSEKQGDQADVTTSSLGNDVPSEPAASQSEPVDPIIQHAESMESVLEQSIPDAPVHPVQTSESTIQESSETVQPASSTNDVTNPTDPLLADITPNGIDDAAHAGTSESNQNDEQTRHDATTSQGDISVSGATHTVDVVEQTPTAASEALDAVAAVEANLNEPILPEEVAPAAHDTPAETLIEQDTALKVEIVPPTAENLDKAIKQEIESSLVTATAVPPPPAPTPSTSTKPSTKPAAKEEAAAIPIKDERPLPEGLSRSSASVAQNPKIVHDWHRDPTNGHIILALFDWSIQHSEVNDARAWYALLSKDNPTAAVPLLNLISLESSLSYFQAVETLFGGALKGPSGGITAAANVNIWKAYLHYIRRQNPVGSGGAEDETKRKIITDAYEFALKQCGVDREAGAMWGEYIDFVQDVKAKNTWETQAQQDNLRKIYQRAVCIPLNNVETIWKAYDAFESGVNKQTSKKFLAERSPAYMTARTALRELRTLTDAIPTPILPPQPTFSDQDRHLVIAWKAYLKWEESNPLVIGDPAVLSGRIEFALRKCLADMWHFPELWHYAAQYFMRIGKVDEAAGVLKAGVEACPKSVLLTFATAEVEEDRKNSSSSHSLFVSLVDRLITEVDELKIVISQEIETARGPEIPRPQGYDPSMDIDMEGDQSDYSRLVREREERGTMVEERRGKEVEDLGTAIGVVWVMYMRFARRAELIRKGIKAARAVFGKARKSPYVTWHIFEASAMMEYHVNKDSSVAIRIFELGLKQFADDVEYVVTYLQFLLSINDDTNARALFERSATKIAANKVRPLWDVWAKYEYMFGDLAGVQKLESRFAEVFPNDSPLKRFAQRYSYNGIDQIALRDLGFGRLPSRLPGPPQPLPPTHAQDPRANPNIQAPQVIPPPRNAGPVHSSSPVPKRALLPDSPRRGRNSIERSHSPSRDGQGPNKRYRANSPGRHDPRGQKDRAASRDYRGPPPQPLPVHTQQNGGGRSPMPPMPAANGNRHPSGGGIPLPPIPGPQLGPGVYPALPVAGGLPGGIPPLREGWDRSGLGRGLAWFVGQLPSARSFDGPVFRPDDIMDLFSTIGYDGRSVPAGPPVPPVGGYSDGRGNYGGPPPRRF